MSEEAAAAVQAMINRGKNTEKDDDASPVHACIR